jgi:beta-1,4-N-acetylglucosaminyltransferase
VIFVTVGTSDFDQLVNMIDELTPNVEDRIVMQIGHGDYVPRNCEYFRFAPSLHAYYDEADLVVAHAGLATTIEVLEKGKNLISVENTTCVDDHQTELLEALADGGYLIWCRNLDDLPSLLKSAPTMNLKSYNTPPCRIADVIEEALDEL